MDNLSLKVIHLTIVYGNESAYEIIGHKQKELLNNINYLFSFCASITLSANNKAPYFSALSSVAK